jgi:hypothetical protein
LVCKCIYCGGQAEGIILRLKPRQPLKLYENQNYSPCAHLPFRRPLRTSVTRTTMNKFFPCFSCGSQLAQEASPTEEDRPRPTASNRPLQPSATVATIPTPIAHVVPAASSQSPPPVASVSSPDTGPPATNPIPESRVRKTVSPTEDDRSRSSASNSPLPPPAIVANLPTSSPQVLPAASLPPAQPVSTVSSLETGQPKANTSPDSRLT